MLKIHFLESEHTDEFKKEEVDRDLQLAVDILNQLKVAVQELGKLFSECTSTTIMHSRRWPKDVTYKFCIVNVLLRPTRVQCSTFTLAHMFSRTRSKTVILAPNNCECCHLTDDAQRDMILIPVATDDDQTLRLVPLDDATFCDTEWLRQGFFPMSFDEQVKDCYILFFFTYPRI